MYPKLSLGLLAALILTLCTQPAAAQHSSSPLKIGLITDLSGPAAYWGVPLRAGAELAVEELRQEKREVQLVLGDNQLDAKRALSEAQKMLNFDQVSAVLSSFTPTSIAVSAALRAAKKIMIYDGAATSPLAISPYAFKTYLDFSDGCRRLAEYWRSINLTRVAVLKAELEFGELCWQGARTVFPDAAVLSYRVGEDTRMQVLRMKEQQIQAILAVGYENDALNLLRSMNDVEYRPRIGVCEHDSLTGEVIRRYGPLLNGANAFGFSAPPPEFSAKLRKKAPEAAPSAMIAGALGYLHTKQLYFALSECPTHDTPCQFNRLNTAPPHPLLLFRGWHNRIAEFDVKVKEFRNGVLTSLE